jgi:GrpB-like predicted nucleotidyltransferase (UPF0157 family)
MRNVVIVEYDPRWSILFEEEEIRVLTAIGQIVLAVEHIGSTAVPDLGAKPIIDMMAGIRGSADADQCIPMLRKIGYTSFTPEFEDPDHYYCCGKRSPSVGYHLHIVRFKSPDWQKHLLFRDYLRGHPETAQQYYELKKELAVKYHSERGNYTQAKTLFIESVIVKATKCRSLENKRID